jgi:homoserine O-acetyltransferase
MVRAQAMLLDHLGVARLMVVVGGSMGGMQALSWAATFPDRVGAALVIASAARHTAQNIAFHEVGRQAIMADPKWRGGDYYAAGDPPAAGLAVARMAAHITYLSEAGLTEKFGRRLQAREAKSFGFDADFQIESYLRHQGIAFVDRFDANSYLYITRAMDYFDLAEEHGGHLAHAFKASRARFCLISFDTDWLYPTAESRSIVHALNAAGAPVSFVELSSPFGHDAFLLDVPELNRVADGFLRAVA